MWRSAGFGRLRRSRWVHNEKARRKLVFCSDFGVAFRLDVELNMLDVAFITSQHSRNPPLPSFTSGVYIPFFALQPQPPAKYSPLIVLHSPVRNPAILDPKKRLEISTHNHPC